MNGKDLTRDHAVDWRLQSFKPGRDPWIDLEVSATLLENSKKQGNCGFCLETGKRYEAKNIVPEHWINCTNI